MMETILEKAQGRFILLLTRLSNRLANIAAQICISMAFSLSPRKYFNGKFCLSCLKSNSTRLPDGQVCQRFLYIKAIISADSSILLVVNSNDRSFFSSQ